MTITEIRSSLLPTYISVVAGTDLVIDCDGWPVESVAIVAVGEIVSPGGIMQIRFEESDEGSSWSDIPDAVFGGIGGTEHTVYQARCFRAKRYVRSRRYLVTPGGGSNVVFLASYIGSLE